MCCACILLLVVVLNLPQTCILLHGICSLAVQFPFSYGYEENREGDLQLQPHPVFLFPSSPLSIKCIFDLETPGPNLSLLTNLFYLKGFPERGQCGARDLPD
jgi:hypothetical protein